MAGKFEVTPYDTHLLIRLQGDRLPAEEFGPKFRQVLNQAAEWDVHVVVVREIAKELLVSTQDLHGWANFLSTSNFRNRLAVVVKHQAAAGVLEFFVNAAKNQGISVRVFSSLEDAVSWVAGNKGPSESAG